jgi:hypothetical protein
VEARKELDWVVANSPNHPVARFYRAMVHRAVGNEEACWDDLQVFLEEEGGTEEYRKLASTWMRQAEKAAASYAKATMQLAPLQKLGAIWGRAQKARALVREGKIHDSVPLYQQVLAQLDAVGQKFEVSFESLDGKAMVLNFRRRAEADDKRSVAKSKAAAKVDAKRKKAKKDDRVAGAADRSAAKEQTSKRRLAIARIEAAVKEKLAWSRELTKSIRQTAHYNIACSHSRRAAEFGRATVKGAKHYEQALASLKQAVTAGWSDYGHMERDSDLDAIRGDSRYSDILIACRSRSRSRGYRQRKRSETERKMKRKVEKKPHKAEKP